MFGYIKKSEVLELLEAEVRWNRIRMNVNSQLFVYEGLTDEERTAFKLQGEEYEHRYDESVKILNKFKELI